MRAKRVLARLALLVVGGSLLVVPLSGTASAGPCERLIHATIEGVGHVCLGP